MLTEKGLQELGVNTKEGLSRCLNNEGFYFTLIKKAINDDNFEKLKDAVLSGDLKTAFEIAHSLKGVMGNLALTPVFDSVCEITELLRAGTQMDYSEKIETIFTRRDAIRALCD